MPINRPDDTPMVDPFQPDPLAMQFDSLTVPDPLLDNTSARQGIGQYTRMLQHIDRTTGPATFNDQAMIANRVANIDPRLSQNQSTG